MDLEKLKKELQFNKKLNYWYKSTKNFSFKLATRVSEKEAFLIEEPSTEEVHFFIDHLKEDNPYSFIYLESNNKRIRLHKSHASSFWTTYFSDNELLQGFATTTKSLEMICKRFIEDTLFDGREPELRTLRKDKWYDFKGENAENYTEDSLYLLPLEQVGLWNPDYGVVKIFLEENWEWNNDFFVQEFQSTAVINPTEEHELLIEKLAKIGIEPIEHNFVFHKNSIQLKIPDIKLLKDNFSYFLKEEYLFIKQHLPVNENYTTDIFTDFFKIIIKGYSKAVFKSILAYVSDYDCAQIIISRPMKRAEIKHKSLEIRIEEQKLFLDKEHSNAEVLSFVDAWID